MVCLRQCIRSPAFIIQRVVLPAHELGIGLFRSFHTRNNVLDIFVGVYSVFTRNNLDLYSRHIHNSNQSGAPNQYFYLTSFLVGKPMSLFSRLAESAEIANCAQT